MRYDSFQYFWPHYLQEHTQLSCRVVHFIGSNLFLGLLLSRLYFVGSSLLYTLTGVLVLGALCFSLEAKRNMAGVLLLSIVLLIGVDPLMFFVILPAYSFAWSGHFFIEKNRPATFDYPLWSLVGDFKMCFLMWKGQLWTDISVDTSVVAK